jgi:hypothetical protein
MFLESRARPQVSKAVVGATDFRVAYRYSPGFRESLITLCTACHARVHHR